MDQGTSLQPASADDVINIVGELEAATVAKIVSTGATVAEVLEAHVWLSSDDYLHRSLHRAPRGRVGTVCEILETEQMPPRDPTRETS